MGIHERPYSMRILLLIVLLCGVAASDLFSMPHPKGKTAYAFGDSVTVRERPDVSGRAIGSLAIGSELAILTKTDRISAIGGYADYWYLVSYTAKDTTAKGYVWGGLISNQHFTLDLDGDGTDDLVLVRNMTEGVYSQATGPRTNPAGNDNALTMRIVYRGKPFVELPLFAHGECAPATMRLLRPRGFDGDPTLLVMSYAFVGEMSGATVNYYHITPSGPASIFSHSSASEGGCSVDHAILMPDSKIGGKKNAILVRETDGCAAGLQTIQLFEYAWDSSLRRFTKK